MTATLLLQARTNSSRLPGKVLLPIKGVPLVVLAALRASNSGHDVIVVTSTEKSDDELCNVLNNWGVNYFRGDLNNTLKRFVDALEGQADNQIIVRLTGDNVFPDGRLLDEMIDDFTNRGLEYLSCSDGSSGYPYGVSAEITRVEHLRAAHSDTSNRYDCEHVTPWIISKYGRATFERYSHLSMSGYRCTVDTLDDYFRICKVFNDISNPKSAKLELLLKQLKQVSTDVVTSKPQSKLIFGAAQLGMSYGIVNNSGQPNQYQANRLVHSAIANGVQYIDTASAYGKSEEVLGDALSGGWDSRVKIITKLSPMDDCEAIAQASEVRARVERSVYKSCHNLRLNALDVLLLHRAGHLKSWEGVAWKTLIDLKQKGLIKKLGVSVQSPEEALLALTFSDVEFIQLPYNILDHRWDVVSEKIIQIKKYRSLTVHARSILLQGLLTSSSVELWSRANCEYSGDVIRWLKEKAGKFSNSDVIELCFRYVISQNWLDGVVVGVETIEQLKENLINAEGLVWDLETLQDLRLGRPSIGDETLNPSNWKQADV